MNSSYRLNVRWCFLAVVVAIGCGEDGPADPSANPEIPANPADDPSQNPTIEDPETGDREYAEAVREHQAAVRGLSTHTDFLELVHLADIDHRGLFIDMGTPARMKYTTGRWENDWGDDETSGERTFTQLKDVGSVYFPHDRSGGLEIDAQLRKVSSASVVVYLNDETLRTVDLADGIQTVRISAPSAAVRIGENQLRFRAADAAGEVSAEIDWIRISPEGTPAGDYTPPRYELLRRDVALGGMTRASIVAQNPTTLSWYTDVPPDAQLAFSMASEAAGARAVITATPAGGAAKTLFEGELTARWTERLVPLSDLASQVIRLDVRTEGNAGESAISGLRVMTRPPRARPEAPARNVVVLTIDTLRASKLRVYNRRSRVQTPVLDAFAAEAHVFDRAQSCENWTKPSVASILTALYPMTHRTKDEAARLPDNALLVSEVFQRADFETAMFSANGYVSDRFGFGQGWDHYTNYIRESRRSESEQVFTEAGDWIEQHKDQRFFVYIQTIDPHVIYNPPERFIRMYDDSDYHGQVTPARTAQLLEDAKRNPPRVTFDEADVRRLEALHDGEISYHDFQFGRFIERLKTLGLYEDMIFVVTSDHGEEFNDHGSWGHGHSVFQELLNVPLMVRWPAVGTESVRIGTTVNTIDVAPTILAAAGLPIPEEFEGRSLTDFLLGGTRPGPGVAFSDFLDDRRVARVGRWKFILRGNLTWSMFDLERDPGERTQLDARTADSIGLRYTRILLGQFLGARDRRSWLMPNAQGPDRVLPPQTSTVDPELCRQLAALGYVDPRCRPIR